MAKKLNNIPNQNNINSVITAKIENTSNITDIVVKAATDSAVNYSSDVVDKVKTYSEIVNTIFGSKGVVTNMINA